MTQSTAPIEKAATGFPAIANPKNKNNDEMQTLGANVVKRIARHCVQYRGADNARSAGQLALNMALYVGLIGAMLFLTKTGLWWASLLLAIPAGGILVRLFIVQHDCGHNAFFKSKKLNVRVGQAISLLTWTPFGFWRDAHNRHHAHSSHLNKRGMGAVDTLTVEEFRALSPWKQNLYRFYRNPFVLLVIGPPVYFLLIQRIPTASAAPYSTTYEEIPFKQLLPSVLALNIGLIAFYGALSFVFGFLAVAAVFVPAIMVAAWAGSWLFFVQHQYEDAYWAETGDWRFEEAALRGSSHYDLPKVLQWFTGNIGFHHIHHLCSSIPNYRLEECYKASADLKALPTLSIPESIKCPGYVLWDHENGRMVSFKDLSRDGETKLAA